MRRPASLQAQRLAASGVAQPLELYRLDDEQGAQSMSHAEKLERLKFDARQAMIEYGIACRKDDQEGIRASTTAAVAAIDALALLAQQPEAVGWVSVEERLPPKYEEVLVAFAELPVASTGQYTDSPHDHDGWCYPAENADWGGGWPKVKWWQPLPGHPKVGPDGNFLPQPPKDQA
jgi:hypothetical protein